MTGGCACDTLARTGELPEKTIMLVNDNEALERINSPFNLLNRIKQVSGKPKGLDIFRKNREGNEEQQKDSTQKDSAVRDASEANGAISIDSLIDKPEDQIKLANAHNKALTIMNKAIDELDTRITEVKADKLPAIITAAQKVVESIRKERNESKRNREGNGVNFHFYIPEQRKISDYEVIEVNSSSASQ